MQDMTCKTLELTPPGQAAYIASGVGEPVVFVHGVGMQSAIWQPQIATFAATHHVIAVDLPGHGQSRALRGPVDLTDFVGWMKDVLSALNLGPVNLVGHSMGALICSGIAIDHPQLVRRVALLNGVHARSQNERAAVTARAHDIAQGSFDPRAPLARWFANTPHDAPHRARAGQFLSIVDPQGYGAAYSAFAHGDTVYAERYTEITAPFLAVTGDGDRNSSPEMARNMARAVQNGRAEIIRGHRHMVSMTNAKRVNASLAAWLKLPADRKAAS